MKLPWSRYISSETQRLAIFATEPEVNREEHVHEFDELVIVDHGSGTHMINGRPMFIQAGDVFYVRHDDAHFYSDLKDLCLTNLLSRKEQGFSFIPPIPDILRLTHPLGDHGCLWIDRQQKPLLTNLLKALKPCLASNDPLITARGEGLLLQTLSLLSRSNPISHARACESPHQIDRLLQYLRAHCTESVDWDWVCQRFGVSTRNLFRIIKRETGHTPDGYINCLRLHHARELLTATTDSITEVAYASGFGSLSYFCRIYRTTFGVSPSEHRKLAS